MLKARIRFECALCDKFVIKGDDEEAPTICTFCRSPGTMHAVRRIQYDDGK